MWSFVHGSRRKFMPAHYKLYADIFKAPVTQMILYCSTWFELAVMKPSQTRQIIEKLHTTVLQFLKYSIGEFKTWRVSMFHQLEHGYNGGYFLKKKFKSAPVMCMSNISCLDFCIGSTILHSIFRQSRDTREKMFTAERRNSWPEIRYCAAAI